jgi:aspartyl-tRNA(Asn)/glutamyl-tRNA(Gln) amidotransferase subunit C
MEINDALIDRLAELSKLEFNAEGRVLIKKNLGKIFSMVEKMNDLDLEGVEPLVYMTSEHNIFRADDIKQELTHEEILMNAPQKDSDFIKVPKVLKN